MTAQRVAPRRKREHAVLGAALVVACMASCARDVGEESPERAVSQLVDRLQRVHGNPEAARAVYDLLWAEGRANLDERARRASAVMGRQVAPEEMIAPSRAWLAFRPQRYETQVRGQWAIVTVTGESPGTQRHEVRCVEEEGRWRVVVELPEVSPIQKRETAE